MSILTSNRRRRGARISLPLSIVAACALAFGIAFAADVVSPDKAEFGGQCAEGLAEGKHVMTDCSVNWKDKDGKTYCFSNDAEKLVDGMIKSRVAANDNLFPIEDELNGEHLKLAYDGIDFTRTLAGYGFFPDVKFHDPKDAQKKYLIDF